MTNPMKITLILVHPRPGSFNHAIADTAAATLRQAGHLVTVHDLYAEQFDPLLPDPEIARNAVLPPVISEHCREIAAADGIVIVHPNWWGMPPAILKGWLDRVLRPGVAYRFSETDSGEGIPIGLLSAKAVLVFNTSNAPPRRGNRKSLAIRLNGSGETALSRSAVSPHFPGRCLALSSPAQKSSGRAGLKKCGA